MHSRTLMTTVVCPLLNQLTPRVYRRGPVVFYVPLHASNLLLFYSSRALIDVAIVVIYFIWTTKLDHGEDCNFFAALSQDSVILSVLHSFSRSRR